MSETRAQHHAAIYPPKDAIQIWKSELGWTAWFPEGTPEHVVAAVDELTKKLAHDP